MKKSFVCFLTLSVLFVLGGLTIAQNHNQAEAREQKITTAVPDEAVVKPEKKRKLLVFSKTNGFRHQSIPTGKIAMRVLGDKTGAYTAVVSDDLSNFEEENIKQFDAICFLNTTLEVFDPSKQELASMSKKDIRDAKKHTKELQKSFMSWIKNGGGFVGIHAATDTFYKWPEYGEMMNGYFDGHPWTAGTQVSVKVEDGAAEHPLAIMFEGENLEFKEEIYQLRDPYDSSEVNMLLRLDTEKSPMDLKNIKRKDKDFGVSWYRDWGKGRVFYCSLGHNHHIYMNTKVLKHYLAGIQWAMGDLKLEK